MCEGACGGLYEIVMGDCVDQLWRVDQGRVLTEVREGRWLVKSQDDEEEEVESMIQEVFNWFW